MIDHPCLEEREQISGPLGRNDGQIEILKMHYVFNTVLSALTLLLTIPHAKAGQYQH